ncbi:7tm odorant receptor domain-containing protein [Phthorimaea operculella]|nr:7tm odorant receptor domain-containing protein [Phthorimaea operculella]
MSESSTEQAEKEIDGSLKLCTFCMRLIGLSFQPPKTATANLLQKLMLAISVLSICYHVFSEIVFIGLALSNSPKVEEVVPLFHTFGYGALSYFAANFLGIWFYNATPIAIYFYQVLVQGQSDAQVGFVWVSWYPFDKYEPFNHVAVYIFEMFAGESNLLLPADRANHLRLGLRQIRALEPSHRLIVQITFVWVSDKYEPLNQVTVYIFEMFAGQTCVWIMIGTDLLFSTMASHICLLLRLLQRRLESVANSEQKTPTECYKDIVDNIKLHQRLIRHCSSKVLYLFGIPLSLSLPSITFRHSFIGTLVKSDSTSKLTSISSGSSPYNVNEGREFFT